MSGVEFVPATCSGQGNVSQCNSGPFPGKAFMAKDSLSPFILAPLGKEHSMDIPLFQAASELHGGMWESTCVLVSRAADPQTEWE